MKEQISHFSTLINPKDFFKSSIFRKFAAKLKNKYIITMTKRILLLFTLIATSIIPVVAGPTFYYKFVADATPTGQGKVYVSNEDETPPDSKFYAHYGTPTFSQKTQSEVSAVTVTAFLYAKPTDGYMFTHWTRVMEDGKEVEFSNAKNCTDLVTTLATTREEALTTYYKAHFAKIGLVHPVSSDEQLGTVYIDIPTNKVGDVVTMTTIPDMFNGIFKGWQRNNSTRLISDNPLTLTVSDANKGIYTAVYESKPTSSKGLYVFLENLESKTYLGVCGSSENTLEDAQRYFKNSLFLVSKSNAEVHSMPSLVIKLKGTPTGTAGLSQVEMNAQGVSTYDISKDYFRVEKYLENDYFLFGIQNGFSGYIKDNGGDKYYMECVGNVHSPSLYNRGNNNPRYRWAFHIIDEENFDENYFGAKASAKTTKDGLYYTTMYTAFPYECRDGVKAYIVDQIMSNGKAHLVPLRENIVPPYTPVLLECRTTEPITNRLMPLLEDVSPIGTPNLLKGELWLNDESGDEANYRTLFDPSTMRVLSRSKAVFSSTNNLDPHKKNSRLTYIANNTCYLDVSGVANPQKEIEFTTEEAQSFMLGDANGDGKVDVVDAMHCVSYVLHKELKVFIFNNADTNKDGVINVTDIMWIVNNILHRN